MMYVIIIIWMVTDSHPNWSWMMTVRYAMNISKMMEAFQWETMM